MKLTFWGVRGSIPTPVSEREIQEKLQDALIGAVNVDLGSPEAVKDYLRRLPWHTRSVAGGNTTCAEVISDKGDEYIVDAGSGIRPLGLELMRRYNGKVNAKILISHDHWDHIQGFPFFVPAYVPGCRVEVYSGDKTLLKKLEQQALQSDTNFLRKKDLENKINGGGNTVVMNKDAATNHTKDVFKGQQDVERGYFPIGIEQMGAVLAFRDLKQYELVANGLNVSYMFHNAHPGGMFSYQLSENGKRIVFAGDFERDGKGKEFGVNDNKLIEWARETDVLVIDAQYTPEEYRTKIGWGHSEIEGVCELAGAAGIKALYLTHHDPTHDDKKLSAMEEHARAYMVSHVGPIPVYLAREGMEAIV
ncbi:MAG: MBL fold metallo-hydrolase [Nanoarchaeota archaeon]|nr:MBL fold metallo-hydrolase [Nanoarchaeota archaeon]